CVLALPAAAAGGAFVAAEPTGAGTGSDCHSVGGRGADTRGHGIRGGGDCPPAGGGGVGDPRESVVFHVGAGGEPRCQGGSAAHVSGLRGTASTAGRSGDPAGKLGSGRRRFTVLFAARGDRTVGGVVEPDHGDSAANGTARPGPGAAGFYLWRGLQSGA